MLDPCRASSLLSTLLCPLIRVRKCHLGVPLYRRPQKDAMGQTTWVDEQVIVHDWLALMIFSKAGSFNKTKLKRQRCPKSWLTFLCSCEVYIRDSKADVLFFSPAVRKDEIPALWNTLLICLSHLIFVKKYLCKNWKYLVHTTNK